MSDFFDDFPGLFDADEQASRALALLEEAAAHVRRASDGSRAWGERSRMLQDAANLAVTAATQIAVASGWNAAASAASEAESARGQEPGLEPPPTGKRAIARGRVESGIKRLTRTPRGRTV